MSKKLSDIINSPIIHPKTKTLGEYVANLIETGGGEVVKLGYTCYINREDLAAAAREMDTVALTCLFEGRKMNKMESIMFNVLADLAGFDTVEELISGHKKSLKGKKS